MLTVLTALKANHRTQTWPSLFDVSSSDHLWCSLLSHLDPAGVGGAIDVLGGQKRWAPPPPFFLCDTTKHKSKKRKFTEFKTCQEPHLSRSSTADLTDPVVSKWDSDIHTCTGLSFPYSKIKYNCLCNAHNWFLTEVSARDFFYKTLKSSSLLSPSSMLSEPGWMKDA